MTEKQIEKQFNDMARTTQKFRCQVFKNIGANNEIMENLVLQMNKDPLIFAYSTDPESRNFMKWALTESMKQTQLFLDKIKEIETAHNLPLENED